MSKKRIALVIMIVAVVGFGAAALWRAGGADTSSSAVTVQNVPQGAATGSSAAAAQITATIYRISKLSIDPSIFSSPAYLSLVDRSQEIPEEPVGRPDPFAPLYQDDVPASPSGRAQGQGGLLNQGTGKPVAATTTPKK